MLKWRHQYDPKGDQAAREATRVDCGGPTKTVTSAAKDADINELVRRFGIDQNPPPPQVFDPAFYGEFDETLDLSEAHARVRDAEMRFQALPAALRRRFDNDSGALWAFVNDPRNLDEAVELGLLRRAESPRQAPNGVPATTGIAPAPNGPQTGAQAVEPKAGSPAQEGTSIT